MAIAYVKEVAHAAPSPSASTFALTVAAAPGAGNLLILSVCQTSVSLSSVADSKGNTWNIDLKATNSDAMAVASTTQNAGTLTTSDTITLTWSGSTSRAAMAVHEFSGATNTVDKSATANSGTTSTTSRTSGAVTTLNANDLIWGAFGVAGVETSFTGGAGYTTPTTDFYAAASAASIEFEYQIVSATGTYTPSGTGGLSARNVGITVAYKAAAGAVANTLTASPASMAITGDAITPPVAHAPTASAGTMIITGDSSILPVAHKPTASPGSIAIAGSSTTLPIAHNSTASPGSISVTGKPILTKVVLHLIAEVGAMAVSGTAATLDFKNGACPVLVPASIGSRTLTPLSAGSLSLAAVSAGSKTLTPISPGGKTLTPSTSGSLALTPIQPCP